MSDDEVTVPRRRGARHGVAVAVLLLYLAMVVAVLLEGARLEIGVIVGNGAVIAIGMLIFLRRPDNAIGAILLVQGLAFGAVTAADAVASGFVESGRVENAAWIITLFAPLSVVAIVFQSLMLLMFPHGRFSSTWDRRFAVAFGAYATAMIAFSLLVSPSSLTDPTATVTYPHPFIAGTWPDDLAEYGTPLFSVLILSFLVAALRLVRRARNSGPIERRQIEWVGLGCVIYWVLGMTSVVVDPLGAYEGGFAFLDQMLALVIPVTIAVGIFRYRLYDIDVIISKSVTYFGLAVVIVGLYAAIVVAPVLMIGASDEGGPGLVLPIVASAMVAVLFEPIRSRLQRVANRLVYGDRVSPHEVLSQVTSRLPDAAAGDGTGDLAQLLTRGTGAERAIVWIASGEMLQASGVFPDTGESAVDSVAADGLVDDEFTESRPVLHQGTLFGALTIVKPHNDPMTPADRQLLSDVAAGSGLLLRNIGLNAQLEQRAADVRASRRRLIAARDAERHRLERDLHDGAQQQVVALKVKLGIARTIAQREGADEIVTRVTSLAEETQQAVDALRAVAHGIYPPLLESEGLEAALRAVERMSPIGLSVSADGLGRYGREAEETVYFCVLETVERAWMSGASGMRVNVTASGDDLVVSLDIDGRAIALELTSVADRIDAAGGLLTVENRPDGMTRITSALPVGTNELESA